MNRPVKVFFSREAEADLNEIFDYIEERDGAHRALAILEKLQEKCLALSDFSQRGQVPSELERIHVNDIFDVSCSPYRIIYMIVDSEVCISIVCDGRREISDLLQMRLFRL